jgi:hypothetical protein
METILNFKCSSEEKEICELENLSDLFLMELHFKKQTGETIINLQKQLQDDIIVLKQTDGEILTLQRQLWDCVEVLGPLGPI